MGNARQIRSRERDRAGFTVVAAGSPVERKTSNQDIATLIVRIFRDVKNVCHKSQAGVAELEARYCRCDFSGALAIANELIAHAEPCIALHARTMRMIISIATGDGERAYDDLLVLKGLCDEGMKQLDDNELYTSSVVCAMRIENVVFAQLFDMPDLTEGLSDISPAFKMYFGYLLSERLLRMGHAAEANGVAYTLLTLLNKDFISVRTYLYLLEAAGNMAQGDTKRARARFDKAWEIKEHSGVLMPFVELHFALLGLPRVNREEIADPEEVKRVDALVRSFHRGWYGLRRKCGLSCKFEPLTPLETLVSALAAMGWRNKEIAHHMLLSENTVKHQLTSVFQKLGITNRSEIALVYRESLGCSTEFDVWG